MNISNHSMIHSIVISKKVDGDDYLSYKSFGISLALHATLLFGASYLSFTKPQLLDDSQKQILISLSEYVSEQPQKLDQPQPKEIQKVIQPKVVEKKVTPTKSKTLHENVQPKTNVPSHEAFTPQKTDAVPINQISHTQTHSDLTLSPNTTKELTRNNISQIDIGEKELARIREMIESSIRYPAIARKLKIEGVVTLSFSLRADGTLENLQLVNSSGSTALDNSALDCVASLDGDYPPLGKKVDLKIPIAFTLKNT